MDGSLGSCWFNAQKPELTATFAPTESPNRSNLWQRDQKLLAKLKVNIYIIWVIKATSADQMGGISNSHQCLTIWKAMGMKFLGFHMTLARHGRDDQEPNQQRFHVGMDHGTCGSIGWWVEHQKLPAMSEQQGTGFWSIPTWVLGWGESNHPYFVKPILDILPSKNFIG